MTPSDVAALTALAAIVKEMGTWPVLSIVIFLVIGPWISMVVLSWISERRHAAVVQMYKNNVVLLETTQQQGAAREEEEREAAARADSP